MKSLQTAIELILSPQAPMHRELMAILRLSLSMAFSSSLLACLFGLPLGVWLAISQFRGRNFWVGLLNTALGLPAVIVGLVTYLLLSRSGPLGFMGLLFTPTAMVIAQVLLITPMVAAMSLPIVQRSWLEYRDLLRSLRARPWQQVRILLWDCKYALGTLFLVAMGRALSEVGAVMTVGGNIAGATRVMTTAIAMETSKGDLSLALALGIVLLSLVLIIMLLSQFISTHFAQRFEASA